MNHNRRVVYFTLAAVLVLVVFSVLPYYVSGLGRWKLGNISLIADVVRPARSKKAAGADGIASKATGLPAPADGALLTRYYGHPGRLVHFRSDTASPALHRFSAALSDLKKGKKRKLRIAWMGDSLIEGDALTQTIRRLLQQTYGGAGVGFVSIESAAARFRPTVKHSWTGWTEETLKSKTARAPLHLSGHVFYSPGAVNMQDISSNDSSQPLFKTLLCAQSAAPLQLRVNGIDHSFPAPALFNRILLDSSRSRSVSVEIMNAGAPVYGISMESESGVVLDNFSFRGITGLELSALDTAFLQSMMQAEPYDLIVLEYGTNLLYNPLQVKQDWYYGKMKPVLEHLRNALPGADFLLVSASDRAFRYDGQWKSALAMDTLVRVQAQLAIDVNAAFFNLYQSMGGEGTIVRWAESSTPIFANKDYIHPNAAGAAWLGNLFFEALLKDEEKLR